MTGNVLDASAVIVLLKCEPGYEKVEAILVGSLISSVNYAKVVSYFIDKGLPVTQVDAMLKALPIAIVTADESIARTAGLLRSQTAHAGLSLGDWFCLALALDKGLPVWTTDRQWKTVTVENLVINLIR